MKKETGGAMMAPPVLLSALNSLLSSFLPWRLGALAFTSPKLLHRRVQQQVPDHAHRGQGRDRQEDRHRQHRGELAALALEDAFELAVAGGGVLAHLLEDQRAGLTVPAERLHRLAHLVEVLGD